MQVRNGAQSAGPSEHLRGLPELDLQTQMALLKPYGQIGKRPSHHGPPTRTPCWRLAGPSRFLTSQQHQDS